jgi:predicted RNase H-like HicB family nuclease
MTNTNYSMIVLWSTEDEAFLARALELPGCIAHGETREEAVANGAIAIENWIDEAQRLQRPIPKPMDLAEFDQRAEVQSREIQAHIQAFLEQTAGNRNVAENIGNLLRAQSDFVAVVRTADPEETLLRYRKQSIGSK